jgi:hypothetical protein
MILAASVRDADVAFEHSYCHDRAMLVSIRNYVKNMKLKKVLGGVESGF